jgi:hypothetical protein
MGVDQYTQIVPGFTGPGDGTKYLYLFLQADNTYGNGLANYYIFWSDGGSDTQIRRKPAGLSEANIKTDNSFTFSSGDTIKFEVISGVLKVYKNGAIHSGLTVTDGSPLVNVGIPGFGMFGTTTVTADNWEGGDAIAAGTLIVSLTEAECLGAQF